MTASDMKKLGKRSKSVVAASRDSSTLQWVLEESTTMPPQTEGCPRVRGGDVSREFDRKIKGVLELVSPDLHDEGRIPEHLRRIETALDQATALMKAFDAPYDQRTVWTDTETFSRVLDATMHRTKTAVSELRHYLPRFARRLSVLSESSSESMSSDDASWIQKEARIWLLNPLIQDAYDAFQAPFDDWVRLITAGIHGEEKRIDASSVVGLSRASQAIEFLRFLVNMETELGGADSSSFRLDLSERLLRQRQQSIVDMLHAMYQHVVTLQEGFFVPDHLLVKGSPAMKKMNAKAETLKKCWTEFELVAVRLTKICPMYTEVVRDYFGAVLCSAAASISRIQDSDQVREFLKNGAQIPCQDPAASDLLRGQMWLLPCLDQLLSMASQLASKIRSKHKKQGNVGPLPDLLLDLEKAFYDAIMVTIGRSTWLLSFTDRGQSSKLEILNKQASHCLHLALRYNDGSLSLKYSVVSPVEDMFRYGAFASATNTLRTGVLRIYNLVMKQDQFKVAIEEESIDNE